jgi:CheY-like chemotaxis protein
MSRLRILYVDDEPDIREIVELSLGLDSALWVRSCASGTEALATATDWSPHMILCDVLMPVMDGPATLARLRECPQTVDTPVVFVTARAQTREIEHFKSLGATGVIIKPFDPMTLAELVRCHLRSSGLTALHPALLPIAPSLGQHSGSFSLSKSSLHFGRAERSLAAG